METRRYNEALKQGWKNYCTKECQFKSRTKQVYLRCKNCGIGFWRKFKEYKKSPNWYCSHHCRAVCANRYRITSPTLKKQAKLAGRPICKHPGCSNKIGLELKLYCSRKCKDEAERLRDYSYEVISAIHKFFIKHNRIPLKAEMMGVYYQARKSFKTWNQAVIAAGFDPIKTRFAKNWVARDGHTCNSLIEKILDDWLFRHHIEHQSHVHYPWGGLMSADFKIGEYWVELFGLKGQLAKYDEYRHKKLVLIRKHHLKLISLTTKDVLSSMKLKTKLAPILMC